MIIHKKPVDRPSKKQLIEVMDDTNRPLAVLSRDATHRQLLRHRSVQVLIFSPDNKIYLQKRDGKKEFFPGRWDVSVRTHPHVGESVYEAAIRALKEELNFETDTLTHLRDLQSCPETGFENVTLFTIPKNTQAISPNPKTVSEGYYYSREELTCLVKEFKELLTPNLVTLWEAGLLST